MKIKLKFSVVTILLAVFMLATVESCTKYPDGPSVSLRTRKARLSNTWKVENYKVNETDFTSLVSDYNETFSKNGDFSYSWGSLNGMGTWSFQNDDKEVKLTGSEDQTQRLLILLKLEEKSLWYYYMDGSDRHEIHLISK